MPRIDRRISTKGEVSWRVRVTLKGFPLVSATFKRKTDAERWAHQTEVEMRTGRYIKTPESKKRTLSNLIERYEQELLPQRGRDKETVKGELSWWKEQLGYYLLSDVTPQLIADYRDKLLKEPITSPSIPKPKSTSETLKISSKSSRYRSAGTIIRYLATLSVCFTYAVKDLGWLEENPVLKVRKPALDNARVRFLSDDENKRLLDACKQSKYPHLYAIVILALSTGARQGEIMNLQWKDIDFNHNVMRLEETKNGERRAIPISAMALSVIENLRKVRRIDTNLIFPRADGQKPFELKKYWKKAVEQANISDFHFHDLRHTTASNLAMSGAGLLDIAHILGHKQLKMVQRYAHLGKQHTAEVLERMNAKQFINPA